MALEARVQLSSANSTDPPIGNENHEVVGRKMNTSPHPRHKNLNMTNPAQLSRITIFSVSISNLCPLKVPFPLQWARNIFQHAQAANQGALFQ